jgi:hypothetical protein
MIYGIARDAERIARTIQARTQAAGGARVGIPERAAV